MNRKVSLATASLLLSPWALAMIPVTMSGPTPAIAPTYDAGIQKTVIYTVSNNVPNHSFPLTVSGILGAITRVTVANDCGNGLPAGPSTCNLGIAITPLASQIGSAISQTLQVNYGGRAPLSSSISFTASKETVAVTVGNYKNNSNNYTPLAYFTKDSVYDWLLSSPITSINSNNQSYLNGVACDSLEQQCVAVGSGFGENGYSSALTYFSSNGGRSWTPSLTAAIPGYFYGVACTSSGQTCMAVGSDIGRTTAIAYVSSNYGSTWQQTGSLNAFLGSYFNLESIACDSSVTRCTAVGFYNNTLNGTNPSPLSYYTTNGGSTWIQSDPAIPLNATGKNYLNSVACGSSGLNCMAIGVYYTGSHTHTPLGYASSNGGVTWTAVNPTENNSNATDYLNGIACDSSGTTCVVVGYQRNTSIGYGNPGYYSPLSFYTSNAGQQWTESLISTYPSANGEGSYKIRLNTISCNASGQNCTASGHYNNGNGNPMLPLNYYTSNGGANWYLAATQPLAQGSGNNYLNGVYQP
ncbi:MAG: hypothetical protein ACHP65_06340 [Legionellales bacterium]